MPKLVDHDVRRHEIAQAMWRVIAREGLPAASARTVAAEAGWSLGAVRHYFTDQDEMLAFATRAMVDGVTARVRAVVAAHRPGPRRCEETLAQLLPLDEERTGEVRVWLAVVVRSHVDPGLDALRLDGWQGLRRLCREVVSELAERPAPIADRALPRTLEAHAVALHAWLDGLTLHAATVPELVPPDEARRQLRSELRRLRAAVRA